MRVPTAILIGILCGLAPARLRADPVTLTASGTLTHATWVLAALPTSAAPITITSGVLTAGRHGPNSVQLFGTDGLLPFTFAGLFSPFAKIAVMTCNPCRADATELALNMNIGGSDLGGDLTYGAESYRTGLGTSTTGEIYLQLFGALLPLPPPPPQAGDTATLTGAFQMTGMFLPPQLPGESRGADSLFGSGVATVSLFSGDVGGGTILWQFRSAEYRFADPRVPEPPPPTPVPEPASLLLLASGLTGLALRRRTVSRREK